MSWNLLDSFLVSLGFHVEHEGIEEFEHHTGLLRSAALRLGTVLTAAAAGVGIFVREISEGMNKVYEFAELNQLSTKSLEAMRYAGIEYGIQQDSMAESLQELNRKLGEAASGIGRGAMLFKRLGLSARDSSGHVRSLWEMLGILSDKMHGSSRAENIALAERIQMDPKIVLLLEQGRAKVEQIRKESEKLIPISDEQYEQAHKLSVLWDRAHWLLGMISKQIAVQIMPIVVQALNWFQKWFQELRNDTASKFNQVLHVMSLILSTVWTWLMRIANATIAVTKYLTSFRLVLYAIDAALVALVAYKVGAWFLELSSAIKAATSAMVAFDFATLEASIWPIAIGAIIVALGLLIDDLWVFAHDGNSVFGDLVKKFPILGEIIGALKTAFSSVGDAFRSAWNIMKDPLHELWNSIMDLVHVIGPILGPIIKKVLSMDLVAIIFAIVTGIRVFALEIRLLAWGLQNIARVLAFIVHIATEGFHKVASIIDKVKSISGFNSVVKLVSSGVSAVSSPSSTVASAKWMAERAFYGASAYRRESPQNNVQPVNNHWTVPVQVITSDPERAGESVHKYLESRQREVTRNGQSAVAY
jgi:hypothetical protein